MSRAKLLPEGPGENPLSAFLGLWLRHSNVQVLVGLQNGAATLEDSWLVSYTVKPTLTIRAIVLLGIVPKGVENMSARKPLMPEQEAAEGTGA